MHYEIPWGMLIVVYLFFGGMSAGLFFVAAIATTLDHGGRPGYARIARMASLLAPWPVALGSGILIFDLGRLYRFYRLFLMVTWNSPMSLGSWVLMAFMGASMGLFWAWLPDSAITFALDKLPRRLQFGFLKLALWPGREKLRQPFALVGLPLAVGVGIYTGVLLGIVQGKPFWNINLLAQMFLFSGLSSGCAVLILVLAVSRNVGEPETSLLYRVDAALMVLELLVVLPYVAHGALFPLTDPRSIEPIVGGPYTFLFWVPFLTVGVLVPLALELYEMRPSLTHFHFDRLLSGSTAALILVGGFFLRYVFVYAGQLGNESFIPIAHH